MTITLRPRSSWTTTPFAWSGYSSRLLDKTRVIYLAPHYPAIPRAIGVLTEAEEEGWLRTIRSWHVEGNGWADIGYALVVCQSGRAYMAGGITHATAHAGTANHIAQGVLFLLGNDEAPTTEAIATFNALGPWLRDTQGFAALTTVRDHGRLPGQATSCAGTHIRSAIDTGTLTLPGEAMALPRNTGTPAGIAALERAIRTQRPDWTITCGPSMAGRTCIRGKHGHRWTVENGQVTDWSTHYVDANGGWRGKHVGGALDLSKDPAPGIPISTYEKAHGDDLVRDLLDLGYGVIWGVTQHFDHPHVDYRKVNTNVVFQGPNYPFRVSEILWVQTQLKTLIRPSTGKPYYDGILDGLRETNTIAGIKAFQSDHGLDIDGWPGYGQTVPAIRTALAAATAPPADVWPKGHISWVQISLNTLGYRGKDGKTLAVDDSLGANTAFAVEAFQEARGLLVDGRPGDNTSAELRKALTEHAAAPKPPTIAELVAPHRLAGVDRYATAAALLAGTTVGGTIYLAASGTDDAAAAPGRVLLARPGSTSLPSPTAAALARIKPTKLVIVGGPASIPEAQAHAALIAAGIIKEN